MLESGKTMTMAWEASRTSTQERREAFKRKLTGRCFWCLRSDHKVTHCRDPVCCLNYKGSSHLAHHCRARRGQPISASPRARLLFPPKNIHSRIVFPPLTDTAKPPPPPKPAEMALATGHPSHRPALKRITIAATESMVRASNHLLTHAVMVSAPREGYRPSSMEVSYALSHQLHVPRHNITKVTRHKLGVFLAEFKVSSERDHAVCKGSINIGGSVITLRPWRSAGGSEESVWWFLVKVALENTP